MAAFISNETEEQLILLRDLTRRFSILHDAQRVQLQMWPIVLFQKAKSSSSEVDLEKRDITFHIVQKGEVTKAFKEACDQLNEWVKWLLGNEWTVRVKLREKQAYRSGPQLTAEKKDKE